MPAPPHDRNAPAAACAETLMHLLAFTDSAFPVGAFSFSNGLESAAEEGLVHDAASLEAYTHEIVRQAAFTDGIAALHAYRGRLRDDYEAVREADCAAIRCKLNAEARQMTRRMGKRLAELAQRILPDPTAARWLAEIGEERTPGTYPAAQGLLFAACGIPERALFCAHRYGTANTVLGAALRCVRVSHYDTQRILFRLAATAEATYDEVRDMTLDEMHAFAPQIDILASLHEKGVKRMFMN